MRRAWLAYLAGGGLLAAGYFFLPALTPLPAATAKVVFYSLVGLSAVAAILVGVRRHRPSNPLVWYLLAAGRLCYLVADMLFFTCSTSSTSTTSRPSPTPSTWAATRSWWPACCWWCACAAPAATGPG
jgi:tellurite resistance protein TehA-like permease